MAARENSGLHAALIIFVMITVVLGISTYMSFRSAEEAESKWVAADQNMKKMSALGKDKDDEIKILQYVLGWQPDSTKEDIGERVKALKNSPTVQKIYASYEQDMAMWGEGVPDANYRNIYEGLLIAIKSKTDQTVSTVADQRKAHSDLDAVTAREQAATKIHDDAAQKAAGDLGVERAKFQADLVKKNEQNKNLVEEAATKAQNQLLAETKKLNDQIAVVDKQIKSKESTIKNQQEEIDKTRASENFEVPDGLVTSVNQRANTVYINLGSADGLRTQVSFSVYDKSGTSATKSKKKGGIEVIKIVDDHTAECRITKDSLDDLILPGDQIYSPIWHRGPRLHFALTGWLDIDGDGENDRALVRTLIEMNGGIVDLEQLEDVPPDPKKITFQTRYLVDTHEFPERVAEKLRQHRNSLLLRAKELGVKVIHVHELLQFMGWKGGEKTVRLGSGGAATDPKAKSGGSEFKQRAPAPVKKDGGAF